MQPHDLGPRAKWIVGVALAAGTAWALPVRWLHRTLADVSSQRATAEAEITRAEKSLDAIPAVDPRTAAAATRRDATLSDLAARAPRGSKLYEALGEAARTHRLRIARIQPVHATRSDPRSAGDQGQIVSSAGYTLEATGDFEDVTAFVSEVESMPLSFVTSVRCAPVASADPASQRVNAEIETLHVQITRVEHERADGEGGRGR